MQFLKNNYRYQDLGLLILRVGIGIMFIVHGWPKITGGPETWAKVGGAMGTLSITQGATIWGFLAAFAEAGGGLLMILGLFFRPAMVLMFCTMLVAAYMHFVSGDGFGGYSHALEAAILFFSLFFIGPGRYSLDQSVFGTTPARRY
ncbi:DoxX family membrane protein [Nibribacter ruber]|uniref:DoxX family membrane protein n=1 Tax=Nibribacter ruber TaxID=2698458 RepID=A0A6P1P3H1_9BACT|nr:DoxX family protein [Nibribacter ruber]QHL88905.1 DoxX family membrane protein [Nibribacter ruber]